MKNLKKRLSLMLAVVCTVVNFLSTVPAKAIEVTPEITFVGVEHSPLIVGDSETFYLSAKGAENVQYRVFQNKVGTDKWEDLTQGYTTAEKANAITTVNGSAKYEAGKYTLSIWVKKAETEGKVKNKNGGYDSYYVSYLNCVSKDDNNRVYTNGGIDVEKNSYVVGETVKVNGIKDISGMKAPYTYKLHIYDVNSDKWIKDTGAYRNDLSFVADKPGTYMLDVWAMSSNSTLWARETQLNGVIYEAWKLKVITVTEKVEEPVVNIIKDGTIYGSEDAKTPMQINKDVNITAKNVLLKNSNIKGNVTVTGDFATLDNVKVEGTIILNPGENGTVNLNNVSADAIEVLSGAANSIHFNNVNTKTLNVNSKNLKEVVRIEVKGTTTIEKTIVKSNVVLESVMGSFGNVEILENIAKTENTVDLKGTFDKTITVKTKATLKSDKEAKISKVVIEPTNNEKISLDGIFGEVEVNKPATVTTTPNTTIVKVTTNSPSTLELGKGSVVNTLDQKGQVVVLPGLGTIDKKINPPTPVTPPVTPPTPTPTYNVTGVTLGQTSARLIVGQILELTATINPDNATNKDVTWTSSNTAVATVTPGTGTKVNVSAMKAGTAVITVSSVDGQKTAKCTITVPTPAPDTNLNATVEVNEGSVIVFINNIKVKNQVITITMYNEDGSLAFINQAIADNDGKCTFDTILKVGKYSGLVNASEAYLSTKLAFEVKLTTDAKLNAAVSSLGNKVTVSVDDSKAANQEITIALYNKGDNNLVFVGQAKADANGKLIIDTVLTAGEYYGFVKANGASLSIKLDFKVTTP